MRSSRQHSAHLLCARLIQIVLDEILLELDVPLDEEAVHLDGTAEGRDKLRVNLLVITLL